MKLDITLRKTNTGFIFSWGGTKWTKINHISKEQCENCNFQKQSAEKKNERSDHVNNFI